MSEVSVREPVEMLKNGRVSEVSMKEMDVMDTFGFESAFDLIRKCAVADSCTSALVFPKETV